MALRKSAIPPIADPKLPAAKRRLRTFMAEPERGAQLARLGRRDEREILDLIYDNKGLEARKRLDQLDLERRSTRTVRDHVRQYRALSPRQRKAERPDSASRQFWALYDAQQVS